MLSSRLAPTFIRSLPSTLRHTVRPAALVTMQARGFANVVDDHPKRIAEYIVKEHQSLAEAKDKILDAADHDTKERWQNQFVWELARHSIAEELVLYPAFGEHLGVEGQNMAEHDRAEHQTVREDLYKFQNLDPLDPDFEPTLTKLWDDLSNHIKGEETEDLPKLKGVLAEDESEALVTDFKRTQHFIPTRNHPSAPQRPPFETVVGLLTAPIDKLKDAFNKFPEEKRRIN